LALAEQAARARPQPRRRRRASFVLAGAAATAALLAITPPGSAVTDWVGDRVKDVVEDDPPPRASGLEELPGGGRVLALVVPRGRDGVEPWIAGGAEPRRLSGAVDRATWSPHARFVAAARGSELFALGLDGERRWSVAAPGPVHEVEWSPDGFRVAYQAGAELRVVAGDGTGDRRVSAMPPGEPPAFGDLAWRPGPGHVLAFTKRRSLFLADLDLRRVLWRITVDDVPRLTFAPGGDRLLLSGPDGLRVLSARDGRLLQALDRPSGMELVDAAWDRSGERFAVVRKNARRAEVLIARPRGRTIRLRRAFAAAELDVVGFSPDNRWLLVDWTETGTWLFLPVEGGRARQITDVRGRFGARHVIAESWCCPP
ncbi:MAG TPA: hypothetical protein VHF89_20820, partial [Solirubrobacteraceae bacterium]|nr:hypothetical protein [Solirubrobacteraceae bacterium]